MMPLSEVLALLFWVCVAAFATGVLYEKRRIIKRIWSDDVEDKR